MTPRESDPTMSLSCFIVRETDNAVLIDDPASGEQHWIPLSQVTALHKHPQYDPRGQVAEIEMYTWIARKKGLL